MRAVLRYVFGSSLRTFHEVCGSFLLAIAASLCRMRATRLQRNVEDLAT